MPDSDKNDDSTFESLFDAETIKDPKLRYIMRLGAKIDVLHNQLLAMKRVHDDNADRLTNIESQVISPSDGSRSFSARLDKVESAHNSLVRWIGAGFGVMGTIITILLLAYEAFKK